MGGLRPDARQSERLGDRGDHRNRAIRRDGENAVDGVTAADLGDRGDVHEVDDFRLVGFPKPQSLRVSVDPDHAQPELTRSPDRAPLVPARADEENNPVQAGRC
jgi:hypothetical protein